MNEEKIVCVSRLRTLSNKQFKSATTTHKSRQKFGFLFMRSRSSFRLCGLLTWRRMCHEFYRLNWCLPEFRKFHLNFEFRFDFLATLTHTHTHARNHATKCRNENERKSIGFNRSENEKFACWIHRNGKLPFEWWKKNGKWIVIERRWIIHSVFYVTLRNQWDFQQKIIMKMKTSKK